MSDDGSFRVILNFAQMAAILTHESPMPVKMTKVGSTIDFTELNHTPAYIITAFSIP
jgi:hypothetical protein